MSISYGTTQQFRLKFLGLKRANARLVSKDLNLLQNSRGAEVAKERLDNVGGGFTFIKRIIIGDETWLFKYDSEELSNNPANSLD